MSKKKEHRCVGCGKAVAPDQKIYRVLTGTANEADGVTGEKNWGDFHKECFERSIDSPQAVLQEVKRLARSSKR